MQCVCVFGKGSVAHVRRARDWQINRSTCAKIELARCQTYIIGRLVLRYCMLSSPTSAKLYYIFLHRFQVRPWSLLSFFKISQVWYCLKPFLVFEILLQYQCSIHHLPACNNSNCVNYTHIVLFPLLLDYNQRAYPKKVRLEKMFLYITTLMRPYECHVNNKNEENTVWTSTFWLRYLLHCFKTMFTLRSIVQAAAANWSWMEI